MRISVAMATYNGAIYLQEQLDSFLQQTRQPDELVVCDDGSTDDTLQILEAFQQQAPFSVQIYRNDHNLGYIKTFEKTLSRCSGDIIFLSDQDDVWHSNKIKAMTEFMVDGGYHLGINDQVLVDSNLTPLGGTMLLNTRAMGLSDSWFVSGCCTAITSKFRDLALPFPEVIQAHDSWLHRLASAWDCRGVLNEPLQDYRRHGSNASQAASLDRRRRIVRGVNFPDFHKRPFAWSRDRELAVVLKERSITAVEKEVLSALLLPQITDACDRSISTLSRRLDLMQKNRIRRVVGVCSLMIQDGNYGLTKAISDLFPSRSR